MNELLAKYPQEIEAILAKYPPEFKRSAVMPLLHLAQADPGYVTAQALQDIAEICGICHHRGRLDRWLLHPVLR